MLAPEGSTWRTISLFAAIASLTNFLEGYSSSYPNTASDTFKLFINRSFAERQGNNHGLSHLAYTWLWSFLLNVWFVGYLVGTFFTPYVNDTYGRKKALLGSNCVSLCGTIVGLLGIWLHFAELLIVARLVASAASGLSFGSLILFLQETTPTALRGKCSFLSEVSYIAINVIGMGMGMDVMLGKDLLALIGLGAVPGVLAILIVLPLKESPKWLLLTRGDKAAALDALNYYRGSDSENNTKLLEDMLKESLDMQTVDMTLCEVVGEVLRLPHLRKAMTIGVLSLQLIVGIWPIIYISTDLLAVHFPLTIAQYSSFAFSCANFVASVAGMCLVEQCGRRPMLIGCGIMNILSLCAYVAADRLAVGVAGYFKYGCIVSLICYGITYGAALGPIAFFITSELVPQHVRSVVQSLVFAISTIINFVFSFATLPLYLYMDVWAFVPLFIAPSMLAIAYLACCLPETKGREIHSIVAELIAKSSRGCSKQSLDAIAEFGDTVGPKSPNEPSLTAENGSIKTIPIHPDAETAALSRKRMGQLILQQRTARVMTAFSLDLPLGDDGRCVIVKALKH